MLFGQVQAFIEVARTGNVSRAAEALYVTQPALTARIQALEKELGEALFVRTGRGVRLTDAGRVFLPCAERAVQAVDDGRQALSDLRSASAGRLALGAAPAVSTYVLPPVLKRFANLHPRVDVAVRTGHSEEILAMVLNDEVQVGLVRTLRHPDIDAISLYEDELVLVCNTQHRFARRGCPACPSRAKWQAGCCRRSKSSMRSRCGAVSTPSGARTPATRAGWSTHSCRSSRRACGCAS